MSQQYKFYEALRAVVGDLEERAPLRVYIKILVAHFQVLLQFPVVLDL